MSHGAEGPLLTLEPLVESVRNGVEAAGWELSGLQKTTSHEFEGRWAGESTRSAYLFFHRPTGPDWASVEVFLDETSQGLGGNLSLVADVTRLSGLGEVPAALGALGRLSRRTLPDGYKAPVALRLRLENGDQAPGDAQAEVRFKLGIPGVALRAGGTAVEALATATTRAFDVLLRDPELQPFLDGRQPHAAQ